MAKQPKSPLWAIDQEIARHEAALERAKQKRERHFADYCRRRPLTEGEHAAVVSRVASGMPLCCEDGREFLMTIVTDIWAELLNDWAYEKLACKSPDKDRDVAAVQGLLRNEPPPGTPGYEVAKARRKS